VGIRAHSGTQTHMAITCANSFRILSFKPPRVPSNMRRCSHAAAVIKIQYTVGAH
jgi:hypothetical protein